MQLSEQYRDLLRSSGVEDHFGLVRPSESSLASGPSEAAGLFDLSGFEAAAHLGEGMTVPTREEMDAKLALVEARSEHRFAEISLKIDRLLEKADEAKSDNRTTRLTIIITVVASVLAAMGALWTTQGNLLSAFQAGLSTKALVSPSDGTPK